MARACTSGLAWSRARIRESRSACPVEPRPPPDDRPIRTRKKKHLFQGFQVRIFHLPKCVSTPEEKLMHRMIVSAGVLLASLLVAGPALAQDWVWTSNRPDGIAPAGVKADFTLSAGEIYVGFRHSQEKFRGSRVTTVEVSTDDVLDFGFAVATPLYDRQTTEADLRLGLTDFFTLEGTVPFIQNQALKQTATSFFEANSDVLGDVSIRGLFDLLEMDGYRLSLTLGASVPTGQLGKRGCHRHREWAGPTLCDAGRLR